MVRKVGNRAVVMSQVWVAPSTIQGGGLGLFAGQNMERGAIFAQYGGQVLSEKEAKSLKDSGQATHLITLQKGCHIDSRVEGKYDLDFYFNNSLVGGLANSRRVRADCNAVFKTYDHPGYQMELHGDFLTKIIYVKTTVAVQRGDELFVWYCRHFPYTLL